MVRIGTPSAVARPEWYDRNPASTVSGWGGTNVAPHAATTRASYTVPSGKKALLEFLKVWVRRTTAATTAGNPKATWYVYPAGAGFVDLLRAEIFTNGVGDKDIAYAFAALVLCTGDELRLISIDDSTGGTMDYWSAAKLTQFDA